MTVRVKICGINDPTAFDAAIAAGADWVGFKFFPPSPRYVTPAQAADAVGPFAGRPAARRVVRRSHSGGDCRVRSDTVRLDVLQLYGAAGPAGVACPLRSAALARGRALRPPPICRSKPAVPTGC